MRGNDLGVGIVHCRFKKFSHWSFIGIVRCHYDQLFLFLLLPLIIGKLLPMKHVRFHVQLVHIELHHLQCSPFLGLVSAPLEKPFVRVWDASHRVPLADRFSRCCEECRGCSFVFVCCRPCHPTGVFRKDRTGQSSIARSKRTQDPVLSVNQSGVVDLRQTK